MANKLYIKEFETLPSFNGNAAQIWAEPASVEQAPVAITSTHAESAAFGTKTKYICITSDINVAFLCSASPGTAAVTGTHFPLWANNYLCFAVVPGQVISGVLWS